MQNLHISRIGTFSGHRDCVYALAKGYEPNTLFSSGSDGLVVEWNTEKPEEGKVISKLNNSVYMLDSDVENGLLTIGENFEGLHIIAPGLQKELYTIATGKTQIFDSVRASDTIFLGLGNGTLLKFSYPELKLLHSVSSSDKSLRTISVSPDNQLLACGFSDNYIRIYRADNLRLVAEWEAHSLSVFTLKWSPDGNLLYSAGRDARIKVWETSTYSLAYEVVAHLFAINHLIFSEDNRFIASCSMDKTIKIWDSHSLRLLKVIDRARYGGHTTSINKLLWLNDNNCFISCSDDRTLQIWNLTLQQI